MQAHTADAITSNLFNDICQYTLLLNDDEPDDEPEDDEPEDDDEEMLLSP